MIVFRLFNPVLIDACKRSNTKSSVTRSSSNRAICARCSPNCNSNEKSPLPFNTTKIRLLKLGSYSQSPTDRWLVKALFSFGRVIVKHVFSLQYESQLQSTKRQLEESEMNKTLLAQQVIRERILLSAVQSSLRSLTLTENYLLEFCNSR